MELRYTEKLESFTMRVGAENMRICFTHILQIMHLHCLQAFLCIIYFSVRFVSHIKINQVAFNIKFDTINLKNTV